MTTKKKSTKKKSTPHLSASPRTVLPGSEKAAFVPTAHRETRTIRRENYRLGHRPSQEPSQGKPTALAKNVSPTPVPPASRSRSRSRQTRPCLRQRVRSHHYTRHARPERRTIKLTGTIAAMQKAFGVTLVHKTQDAQPTASAKAASPCPRASSAQSKLSSAWTTARRRSPTSRLRRNRRRQRKDRPGNRIRKAARRHRQYLLHPAAGRCALPVPRQRICPQVKPSESSKLGGGYKTADITAYFKTLKQKAPKVSAVPRRRRQKRAH